MGIQILKSNQNRNYLLCKCGSETKLPTIILGISTFL